MKGAPVDFQPRIPPGGRLPESAVLSRDAVTSRNGSDTQHAVDPAYGSDTQHAVDPQYRSDTQDAVDPQRVPPSPDSPPSRVRSSKVPAVEHALAILRLLASRPGPEPAALIARELGLPRSTTYHQLSVLAAHGFVTHVPEERRYGLGIAAFEVGSAYLRHDPLERLARPLLVRLVDEVGETCHLGVLHGRETLYLVKEQPRGRHATLVTEVGVRLPAHLTASGRAMLAGLPSAQVRALFPNASAFVNRTGRGPRSLSELRRLLTDERRRGYAVEDGFITDGLASVAVPVSDHRGHPTAAISITFVSGKVEVREREELAAAAASAAAALRQRITPSLHTDSGALTLFRSRV